MNGGRKLAPEDKAALDIWYVTHISLGLDFKIVLRTLLLLYSGEQINQEAVLRRTQSSSNPRRLLRVYAAVVARPAKASGDGAIGGLASCRMIFCERLLT